MPVVVQKYGGSSVADVEKLQRVAEKVVACKRAGNDVVVVVSAMGKTTDDLLALAHRIDPSPPRRELDMLLSTGERISMSLLSMAIQRLGVEAISFTGSQSGIITNDRHFDARIIDVRAHRVEDELARGRVVIIAGYQGMSYKREITTLGRGGTDTTALAMAAALGAEYAEIYSDVDGVYSADPRKVPGAQHLPEIGYEQMHRLSEAGARVLHAKAVEFAKSAGIPIRARSTVDTGRETIVRDGAPGAAVVGLGGIVQVIAECESAKTNELLTRIAALRLRPRAMESEPGRIRFWVQSEAVPDWAAAQAALEAEGARLGDALGRVTYVGGGADTQVVGFVEALSAAGINTQRLDVTPLAITALVGSEHVDSAVAAVHGRLIG